MRRGAGGSRQIRTKDLARLTRVASFRGYGQKFATPELDEVYLLAHRGPTALLPLPPFRLPARPGVELPEDLGALGLMKKALNYWFLQ